MNKVAQVIGWVTMLMLIAWFCVAVALQWGGTVQETPPNPKAVYYWECRVSQNNPVIPWKQTMSNKAEDSSRCGDLP